MVLCVFVCEYFYWLKQYVQKKNPALLAQKLRGGGNCQNPFQAILRIILKKKKEAWTTKPLGGGGDLSGPTTKKHSFNVCLHFHHQWWWFRRYDLFLQNVWQEDRDYDYFRIKKKSNFRDVSLLIFARQTT